MIGTETTLSVMGMLISGLREAGGSDGLTSTQIEEIVKSDDVRFETLKEAISLLCGDGVTIRRIGNRLREFKGRRLGNACIRCRIGHARTRYWYVKDFVCGDSSDSGDSFVRYAR